MEAKNNEKSMPQNRGDAKGPNNTPAKTAHEKPRKPVFPDFFLHGSGGSGGPLPTRASHSPCGGLGSNHGPDATFTELDVFGVMVRLKPIPGPAIALIFSSRTPAWLQEQVALNQRVRGSNPRAPPNLFNGLAGNG